MMTRNATVMEARTATGAATSTGITIVSRGTATNASPKPKAERTTVARKRIAATSMLMRISCQRGTSIRKASACAIEEHEVSSRGIKSGLPQHGGQLSPMIGAVIDHMKCYLPVGHGG